VLHEVGEDLEHLRFDRHMLPIHPQLEAGDVDLCVLEPWSITHGPPAPRPGVRRDVV
jgi:hypothetical protein